MKVRLLPLAISAAIAMPGIALADGPTLYGKFNVTYERVNVDNAVKSESNWVLQSNASRVGVKGNEKINDNLSVVYLAEWELDATGDKSSLGERSRYVGLSGGFGTLIAGKYDSPLKSSQGSLDQFNDLDGDLANIFVGENRIANAIQYSTPNMSGFQANVAIIPGENFDTGQKDPQNGPADGISASVTYKMDNFYVAVAHDSKVVSKLTYMVDYNTAGVTTSSVSDLFDTTRVVGVFNMDALQVGAMYQKASTSNTNAGNDIDQDGFLVGASYKVDAVTLKAQAGQSTTTDNTVTTNQDLKGKTYSVGADYGLSKQTKLFAFYTDVAYDPDGAKEHKKGSFAVGIDHKF